MSDFSLNDIYEEALKKLQKQRAQAGQASTQTYKKLSADSAAAYEMLNKEARVNKALADRAFGTTGERITTIKQRGETNLRNTLGKNKRQRRDFEDSVDLALKNYETRQAAADTALAATISAAEDAAAVSQGNFDRQIDLQRQQLNLQKQQSRFDRSYALYVKKLMDDEGFEAATGYDVRRPGRKASFNAENVTSLIEDVETQVRESEIAAIKENRHHEGVYAYADTGGTSDVSGVTTAQVLENNKDELIRQYGPGAYNIALGYFWATETIEDMEYYGFDLPVTQEFTEFVTNIEANIDELGIEEFLSLYDDYISSVEEEVNAAWQQAYTEEVNRTQNGVTADFVREYFPFAEIHYEDTFADRRRQAMGLLPENFDMGQLINGLTEEDDVQEEDEDWEAFTFFVTMNPPQGYIRGISPPLTLYPPSDADSTENEDPLKLTIPPWYVMPDIITDETLYDLLAISYYELSRDNFQAPGPDDELWRHGANLYNQHEVIGIAESLPGSVRASYILNIPGSGADFGMLSEADIAFADRLWNSLPEEERYSLAIEMINDNYEYLTAMQRAEFEERMIEQGQVYALDNGYVVTDEQALIIEGNIYYYENLDQTDAYEAAMEWAEATYGEEYESVPVAIVVSDWTNPSLTSSFSGFMLSVKVPKHVETSWNASTLLLNNPDNDQTINQINDIISYATWQLGTGDAVDDSIIAELREYELDDIADILESGWNGVGYYELTDGAVEMIREDWYGDAEIEAYSSSVTVNEDLDLSIRQGLIPINLPEDVMDVTEDSVGVETENTAKLHYESVLQNSDAQSVIDGVLDNTDEQGTIQLVPSDPDPSYTEVAAGMHAKEVIDYVLNADWDRIEYNLTYGRAVGASNSTIILDHDTTFNFDYVDEIYPFLTETERDTLLYYYGKGDTTRLMKYIDIIEPILKERRIEYREQIIEHEDEMLEQFVQQEGLEGEVKAAVLSTVYSFLSFPAFFDTLEAGLYGEEVDVTSDTQVIARRASEYAELAKSTTSNVIVRWVEDVFINILQNLPYFFAGPFGAVMMGLNAAGQTAAQLNDEGYSIWMSIGYSTMVGVVEAATECMAFKGIEALGEKLLSSAAVTKNVIGKICKTAKAIGIKMMPEIAQEFTAGVLENVLDVAFLGENSQYATLHQQYMNAGMTAAEADLATFIYQFVLSPLYQASVALGTSAGMATASAVNYLGSVETQISAVDKMLQNEQLASRERAYLEDLKTKLTEKLNTQRTGNSAQSTTTQANSGSTVTQTIAELSALDQTAKASTEVSTAIGNFVIAMQEMGGAVPADVYDTVIAAYRTFEASDTNGNALAMLNTAMQSIDIAIAQQTAAGGDTTALTALKTQLDSALSTAIQGQTGTGVTQTNPAVTQRAMSNAVSTLLNLPANSQTQANVGAANEAYYDYLTASPENKAAAYDKAVKLLRESINAALENPSLDAGTKAALQTLLDNIDSGKRTGDNGNIKPPNPLHDAKLHTDEGLQKIIEGEGISVNEFAALLDADRVLTPDEKALVRRVLQKIGKPKKGTEMQKVIPQKDIQSILNGDFGTVRKSVAQASHVSMLKTLAEIYYGLRLDFNEDSFTFNDKTYGRIRYTVEDESSLDYSINVPGYTYPYTGRGFLGTDKVIVPEYMQTEMVYLDGSIFEIVDANTGEVIETYEFDRTEKVWNLKEIS